MTTATSSTAEPSPTFPERYRKLSRGFRQIASAQPAVMDGFSRLHRHAVTEGVLTAKTKELMALAIGVSARCEGCITFHVHDAIGAGATREEIEETVAVAVMMGGGPAVIYGIEALEAYDEFMEERS